MRVKSVRWPDPYVKLLHAFGELALLIGPAGLLFIGSFARLLIRPCSSLPQQEIHMYRSLSPPAEVGTIFAKHSVPEAISTTFRNAVKDPLARAPKCLIDQHRYGDFMNL